MAAPWSSTLALETVGLKPHPTPGQGEDAGFADAGTYVVLGGTVSFNNNGFPETDDSDAGNAVAGKYRRNTVPGTDRLQIHAHQSDAFSADGISLDIQITDGAVESCFLVGYYAPVGFLRDCEVHLDELTPGAGTISGTFTGKMSQETCCSTLFPEDMNLDGGTLLLRVAPQ